MAASRRIRIDKHGALALPDDLRRAYGLHEHAVVTAERHPDGILLRPIEDEVEVYSPRRKAALLLTNAVDEDDYGRARKAVRAMGLDPDTIDPLTPADKSHS